MALKHLTFEVGPDDYIDFSCIKRISKVKGTSDWQLWFHGGTINEKPITLPQERIEKMVGAKIKERIMAEDIVVNVPKPKASTVKKSKAMAQKVQEGKTQHKRNRLSLGTPYLSSCPTFLAWVFGPSFSRCRTRPRNSSSRNTIINQAK